MSGHTPGPWFAGRALRGGQECIVGDGDSVVCFMPDRTIGCTFVRDDALLIAASPMLLKELRSANTQMEMAAECIEAGRYDEALLHVRSLSRLRNEAIAAATGEQS